jgi:hypothetical protein
MIQGIHLQKIIHSSSLMPKRSNASNSMEKDSISTINLGRMCRLEEYKKGIRKQASVLEARKK